MRRPSFVALFALLFSGGCADLDAIELGTCGNGVLERGEDCDGRPDPTLGDGLACATASSPAPCRYDCDADARCPLGWECGPDTICVAPSHSMRAGPTTLGWFPDSFETVDFNGDGWTDLAGAFADRVELRPGAVDAAWPTAFVTTTFPATGPIAVGDLDGDAEGDVLLPTTEGFLLWRGQPVDRPLEVGGSGFGTGAPNFLIVPGRHATLGEEELLMATYDVEGITWARVITPDRAFQPQVPIALGERVADLGGQLVHADFDEDGSDDFVFAFLGSARLPVNRVRVDAFYQSYDLASLVHTGVASGLDVSRPCTSRACDDRHDDVTLAGGALAADVDGDGLSDILASIEGPTLDGDAVIVCRNLGRDDDGTFLGFAEPYVDTRFETLDNDPSATPHRQWPLAAANLDGDAIADFVGTAGVFVSDPDPPHALHLSYVRSTLEPWTAAHPTDFDGDLLTDFVAFTAGHSFVDLLRCRHGAKTCHDDKQFIAVRHPTSLGVEQVASGFLRGNLSTDIAVLERAEEGSGEEDRLSILFGRPYETPEPPIQQSR